MDSGYDWNQIKWWLTWWNFVSVWLVALFATVISWKGRSRFTKEAYRGSVLPFTMGSTAWVAEYALRLRYCRWPELPLPWLCVEYFLNTVVSWFFFSAGHAFLRFEKRIHDALAPESPNAPRMHALRRLLGFRPAVATIGMSAALVFSVGAAHRLPWWVAELVQDMTAMVGMFVLGVGIVYTLSREHLEFTSVASGGSISLYGLLQPLQMVARLNHAWFVSTYMFYVLFKVTLLIALASFFVVIAHGVRIRRQEGVAASDQEWENTILFDQLHEAIGGKLAAIMTTSDLVSLRIRRRASPAIDPELNPVLKELEEIFNCADEAREFIAGLRGGLLRQPVTFKNVRDRLDQLKERGMDGEMNIESDIVFAEREKQGLAQIALEALRNVEKHAQATSVRIDIRKNDQSTIMTIEDNGIGLEESQRRRPADRNRRVGCGLESMRATAYKMGGTMQVLDSHPGTKVVVTITAGRGQDET